MKKLMILTILVMVGVILSCSPVFAISFNFVDIPPDNGINISNYFSGELIDNGGGQVLFKIFNNVPSPSGIFIGSVFFDFGQNLLSLIGFDSADSSPSNLSKVDFVQKTSGKFPQGSNLDPKFVFNVQEVAHHGGSNKQGIDDGEVGAFLFSGIYADAASALQSGDLRVGIHVQGIPFYNSDSYVSSSTVSPVPEPSTLLLVGLGIMGFAAFRRKRKPAAAPSESADV